MSMVEQKFSALDSFVVRGYEFMFFMRTGKYSIAIAETKGVLSWSTDWCKDADEAMNQALRYLRKINKTPKP